MAKSPNADAGKVSRRTLDKAKEIGAEARKKVLDIRKTLRESVVPNALVATSGTAIGAVGAGVLRGFAPDTIEVGGTTYNVGWVKDGLGIITGVGIGTAGALLRVPYVIHVGGGVFALCSGSLAERGTGWIREMAMVAYGNWQAGRPLDTGIRLAA